MREITRRDSATAADSLAIEAVTFDVDGTLYDTRSHTVRVGWRLLPHMNLLRTYVRIVEEHRLRPGPDLLTSIILQTSERTGTPPEVVQRELDRCLQGIWVAALRPRHCPLAITALLHELDQRGIPRAVVSDHPSRRKLTALGLSEGWSAVVDASALGALKPQPDAILRAASSLGVPPERVLHIGDRDDTDGESARRAGARYLDFSAAGQSLPRPWTAWGRRVDVSARPPDTTLLRQVLPLLS